MSKKIGFIGRLCLISVVFISFIFLGSAVHGARMSGFMGSSNDFVPTPRLISPILDKVDLTGKADLEFKWSPFEGDRIQRKSYDFRLYKSYEMLESTLMVKKELPPDVFNVSIPASSFKDGEIYTWSLRQIYYPSNKSRRVQSSFKVIMK